MPKLYKQEVHDFIRENAGSLSRADMVEQVNERFGTSFTLASMKSYYANHDLHVGIRATIPRKLWTPELEQLVLQFQEGRSRQELAELLQEKTGIALTANQVGQFCKRIHAISGVTGRFEKGQTSWAKGKKWDEYMPPETQERIRKTQFKPGDDPHNYVPIGTISKTRDGYMILKVSDEGTQRERWKFLHRLIWEEAHGPIPAGHVVSFKDGNPDHCTLDNLMQLTIAENTVMNSRGYRSSDARLTETGLALTKVKIAIRKRRRA